MTEFLLELALFGSKILILLILFIGIAGVFGSALAEHKKLKKKKKLEIEDLGEQLKSYRLKTWFHTRSSKECKKQMKLDKKQKKQDKHPSRRVYVLDFKGDMQASQVARLREEVSILLQSLDVKKDEVVLRLHNRGGMVSSHGLAACQLQRLRDAGCPLTVCVDEVAGSGGYLMACVGTQIIAAPFAILGSIGVLVQTPNFYRFLQKQKVDFEEHHAGEFKRTVTLFGETTDEKREKLKQQLSAIHESFKNYVVKYRPQLDLKKVATGEHWLGTKAQELGLVDIISTSDDYILSLLKTRKVYSVCLKEEPLKGLSWLKNSLQNTEWGKMFFHLMKSWIKK